VSLTALMERVHSDGAIPAERNISLLMRYVDLNEPPILASIAYLDTSAKIRESGA